MSKTLCFISKGTKYKVDERGNINGYKQWKLRGVSFHHWRKGIDLSLEKRFENPKAMAKGLVWDLDHGTTRRWSSRVESAWLEN